MGIAVAPQGDAIFPGLSVRKHLECGAHTRIAWRERRQRIEQIYKIFPPLEPLQQSLVGKLSGGERRMVSIGRMLMADAKLYLIDEPSLGLAPKISQRVMEALWAHDPIVRKSGHTESISLNRLPDHLRSVARRFVKRRRGRSDAMFSVAFDKKQGLRCRIDNLLI